MTLRASVGPSSSWWLGAILLSLIASGCSGQTDVAGPAAASAIDGLEVRCSQSKDQHYLVDVVSHSGSAPVRFEFSGRDGGLLVAWSSRRLLVGSATLPSSCAPLSRLATWYYEELPRLERELAPAPESPLDGWGCDTNFGPDWVQAAIQFLYGTVTPVDLNSCDDRGHCCDTHDICYAQNGCTASSWTHTLYCIALGGGAASCLDACDGCNLTAAGCFAGGPVGPSTCCSPTCNICGIPRNSVDPVGGCVADCMCPVGWICDPSSGNCYQQPAGFCGDHICDAQSENCGSCPIDCGCPYPLECSAGACLSPTASCGDGWCDSNENCETCPSDCPCPSDQMCSLGGCTTAHMCSPPGGVCSGGSDCCGGLDCSGGTCVDPICPSGRYCSPDTGYDCGDPTAAWCDFASLCCVER